MTAYADLMKAVWLGQKNAVSPTTFQSKLESFAPQFAGGAQHDAQEFLGYLLDGIHEDLNRVHNKPYIEDAEGDGTNEEGDAMMAWQNYLQRDKSVVVDVFQGQLRNTLRCRNSQRVDENGELGCGHKSVKFEPFMYLSVPVSDSAVTLENCLENFCREEKLCGHNQWFCPRCQTRVDATKKFDLWMLPPILIVHMKRFKHDRHGIRSKINRTIHYPLTKWDLTNSVNSNSVKERHMYDLYAVSNHVGDLGGGHYTAYAMNRVNDQWYSFNDRRVSALSPDILGRNNSAYVLFYNRTSNEDSGDYKNGPVVYRQSLARPENWPHLKNFSDLRRYRRSSVAKGAITSQNFSDIAVREQPTPTFAMMEWR